jgi:hypothetical protein
MTPARRLSFRFRPSAEMTEKDEQTKQIVVDTTAEAVES